MPTIIKREFLIAVVIPLLLACTGCKPSGGGVTVAVTNASGGEVSQLTLKFTGGSKSALSLKAGGTFETRVNPTGESHLVLEFTDASGKQHGTNLDVYFEPNYSGVVRVTIQGGGKVTWKDETKV